MKIQSYRDLVIWQEGRKLVSAVYRLAQTLPPEEKFGLVSQMRRAAVSIPSNIAEGWARHYPAEFIQSLRTANGSLAELETQLTLAVDLEFLAKDPVDPLLADCHKLGRQILTLERRIAERAAMRSRAAPPVVGITFGRTLAPLLDNAAGRA